MLASATRDFYASVGIDTIPLERNGKRPIYPAWPTKPGAEQWRTAPSDANIGIRHCGKIINVECDNRKVPDTSERILAGLNGRGITHPPIVKSASTIGRHIYLYCPDAPADIAYRNLSSEIGTGELRVGVGAMSVLPQSSIDGVVYELISGDWRSIPIVEWRDVVWVLPLQRVFTYADTLPVRLNLRPLPAKTINLFEAIARARRGEAVGQYPSRSEAEGAIVSAAILNGWDFAAIRAVFKQQSTGHYKDAKRHGDRYLETTYSNALAAVMSPDVRQSLASMYQEAEARTWTGKAGISDRAAYLAVLAELYRAGAVETSISVREVSEHAALSVETSRYALARLTANLLIERVRTAAADGKVAAVYRVAVDNLTRVTDEYLSDYRQPPIVTSVRLSTLAELASRGALGPSAVMVYEHLDSFDEQSIVALARATGRARSTVAAALGRLANHGLAVQTNGGGWIQGPNDLASVADQLNCAELAAARRERHANDRARYQRVIEMRKDRRTGS